VFVWAVFLGATVIFRQGIMYTIDILPESLPAGINRTLRLLVVLIDAFFIFVVFRFGVDLAVMGVGRISQPSGIRIVYAFASIPISAAFMVLFLGEIALRNLMPKEGR
jgi:TRAP-type C4-dicarboxylate transport system permease small subunit